MDHVCVEGKRVERPSRVSRSQWEDFWHLVTMAREIERVVWKDQR